MLWDWLRITEINSSKETNLILNQNKVIKFKPIILWYLEVGLNLSEEKSRLLNMEIRVSIRRGNALAKLNRIGEAI